MTTTTARQPITPITDIERMPALPSGRLEVWSATSRDRQWLYQRLEEVGTPWLVIHVPTGLTEYNSNLVAARRWTAKPSSVDWLRMSALEILDQSENTIRRTMARRALLLLDGQLLPATTEVEALCECGGYLARADGRIWMHVDTCPEQVDEPDQPCPDGRYKHKTCPKPAPVQCEHPQCVRDNDLTAWPCDRGHKACCGCCHGGL